RRRRRCAAIRSVRTVASLRASCRRSRTGSITATSTCRRSRSSRGDGSRTSRRAFRRRAATRRSPTCSSRSPSFATTATTSCGCDRYAGRRVKFCSACGSPRIERRIPEGDTLPRDVCADCGTIHYQNPKIVVGCLPQWERRILLCRRAIEPRYGLWTLPAGFLENGETLVAGAVRETLEEADARVDVHDLYAVISLPQINQVYMMFRARLLDLAFGPGSESLEVRLFDESE